MTGPRGGVIGVRRDQALASLVTQMPTRFETSDDDPWLNAALVAASTPRRADSIELLLEPAPPGV
jgi:calcineurin-like phosphoesterase